MWADILCLGTRGYKILPFFENHTGQERDKKTSVCSMCYEKCYDKKIHGGWMTKEQRGALKSSSGAKE